MRPFDVRLVDSLAPGAPYYARYSGPFSGASTGLYYRRDYWELTATLTGEARNVIVGPDGSTRSERLVPGQIFLWRPQDLHVLIPLDPPGGFSFVQVGFPTAEWLSFADLMGIDLDRLTAERPPMATFDLEDADFIGAFDTAIAALDGEATMVDLTRFWVEIVPRLLPPSRRRATESSGPRWLASGVEAMRREQNLRAGLPRFLELVHVSRRQLARATQRYYGMTPTDLVADLRLRHAARLLSTSEESIGSISRRVGFDDAAYFSNRFRRATSVSPREYRDRARGVLPSAS